MTCSLVTSLILVLNIFIYIKKKSKEKERAKKEGAKNALTNVASGHLIVFGLFHGPIHDVRMMGPVFKLTLIYMGKFHQKSIELCDLPPN